MDEPSPGVTASHTGSHTPLINKGMILGAKFKKWEGHLWIAEPFVSIGDIVVSPYITGGGGRSRGSHDCHVISYRMLIGRAPRA